MKSLPALSLVLATVFAIAPYSVFSQAEGGDASVPQGTKKVMLKIASVETAGTRHEKTWTPHPMPPELAPDKKPYTEAEMMQVTPEEAARMRAKNEAAADALRLANAKIAYENWKAADQHMKGVHAQLEGNAYGRQIILALDKFAGEAATYFDPDVIEFFHNADLQEQDDLTQLETLAAPYFIKLIFDDPREKSTVKQVNVTVKITTTTYMQTITYEVQNNHGKIVTAGNVKKEKQVLSSNAVQTGGTSGNELVEVLEEALAEVAKRINDHFVAKVSFKLFGPPKDEEFNENVGSITVDGEVHNSGEEFSILKGAHTVEVEMDDYKPTKLPPKITKSGEIKIQMLSTLCEVTVKVKAPAGDSKFDPNSAIITLAGDQEFSPSNDEPQKVPQGKYKLTVDMDGYKPYSKEVTLGGPKQTLQVPLKKDAVAASDDATTSAE